MSVPNNVFIDTSIFDQQSYNFDSAAFRPFIAAISGKGFSLILPDPTSREVRKHIAERADAVVSALEDSRRKAPFLAKLENWPVPGFALSWEVRKLGMAHWREFLNHFKVTNLPLDGANLDQVMHWYDNQHAPFGPKKKKEFPDALAFSAILAFAKKQRVTVAVISLDPDFRSACGRFSEVLSFRSLPVFTETLIASDRRVETVRAMFDENPDILRAAVKAEFTALRFYPAQEPDGRVDGVDVDEVSFPEFHVVGVGENECMIAFDALVKYCAFVEFDDPESAIVDSSEGIFHKHRRFSGIVTDDAEVSGTAKIKVSGDWSAFEDVSYFAFNESEVEVREVPPEEWYMNERTRYSTGREHVLRIKAVLRENAVSQLARKKAESC